MVRATSCTTLVTGPLTNYINFLVGKLDALRDAPDAVRVLFESTLLDDREKTLIARALAKGEYNVASHPVFTDWTGSHHRNTNLHIRRVGVVVALRRMADEAIKAATPTGVDEGGEDDDNPFDKSSEARRRY